MGKYGDITEPAMEDWLIPSDYSTYRSSAIWGYFRLKGRSHQAILKNLSVPNL